MTTINITFTLDTTDAAASLGFEAWVDDVKFIDVEHVDAALPAEIVLADDEAEHELRLVMKGKTTQHTRVDEAGEIVSDACLTISRLAFDEIELKQVFVDQATYTHDFNGTGETTETKFYGTLGCNGVVSLKFSTPMYLWLLEHM